MNKTLVFGIILIILVAVIGVALSPAAENQQKKETITLVNDAAQQIQLKGEAAFPEFYNTPWYYGDKYVFVWRIDGVRVVYPPDPRGIGKNQSNPKDSTGKPIGMLFIQTAINGGGWVEYLWPKPGTNTPTTKITYIKEAKYNNQTYLIGSGYYTN